MGVHHLADRQAEGGRELNFRETTTGSDLTREWKAFEARAEALPADHRAAWEEINCHFFPYSDFTGFCDELVGGSRTYADVYQESTAGKAARTKK
ncbi:DNA-binding ferritin-like protein (Dps family) [Saccharothrix carnea]|uniref:DNA-binding ferritin-like protein (Dps family) n=1 Tax=Saccharothrix carnea TaxID=1280637 RepID=A0A2P8HEI1_SACCR|nr:DUF1048 domain-containing protein [Saccharothrix carnea]PSL44595.1 DNA-binding ferritin-like protein (Dps family) [Saccharothrix carnea]